MIIRIVILTTLLPAIQQAKKITLPMPLSSFIDTDANNNVMLRTFDFVGTNDLTTPNPKNEEREANFKTEDVRMRANDQAPPNVQKIKAIDCISPIHTARCADGNDKRWKRWGWNAKKQMCVVFLRGNCGGNGNHYESKEDCDLYCNPKSMITTTRSPIDDDVDIETLMFCQQASTPYPDFFIIPQKRSQGSLPQRDELVNSGKRSELFSESDYYLTPKNQAPLEKNYYMSPQRRYRSLPQPDYYMASQKRFRTVRRTPPEETSPDQNYYIISQSRSQLDPLDQNYFVTPQRRYRFVPLDQDYDKIPKRRYQSDRLDQNYYMVPQRRSQSSYLDRDSDVIPQRRAESNPSNLDYFMIPDKPLHQNHNIISRRQAQSRPSDQNPDIISQRRAESIIDPEYFTIASLKETLEPWDDSHILSQEIANQVKQDSDKVPKRRALDPDYFMIPEERARSDPFNKEQVRSDPLDHSSLMFTYRRGQSYPLDDDYSIIPQSDQSITSNQEPNSVRRFDSYSPNLDLISSNTFGDLQSLRGLIETNAAKVDNSQKPDSKLQPGATQKPKEIQIPFVPKRLTSLGKVDAFKMQDEDQKSGTFGYQTIDKNQYNDQIPDDGQELASSKTFNDFQSLMGDNSELFLTDVGVETLLGILGTDDKIEDLRSTTVGARKTAEENPGILDLLFRRWSSKLTQNRTSANRLSSKREKFETGYAFVDAFEPTENLAGYQFQQRSGTKKSTDKEDYMDAFEPMANELRKIEGLKNTDDSIQQSWNEIESTLLEILKRHPISKMSLPFGLSVESLLNRNKTKNKSANHFVQRMKDLSKLILLSKTPDNEITNENKLLQTHQNQSQFKGVLSWTYSKPQMSQNGSEKKAPKKQQYQNNLLDKTFHSDLEKLRIENLLQLLHKVQNPPSERYPSMKQSQIASQKLPSDYPMQLQEKSNLGVFNDSFIISLEKIRNSLSAVLPLVDLIIKNAGANRSTANLEFILNLRLIRIEQTLAFLQKKWSHIIQELKSQDQRFTSKSQILRTTSYIPAPPPPRKPLDESIADNSWWLIRQLIKYPLSHMLPQYKILFNYEPEDYEYGEDNSKEFQEFAEEFPSPEPVDPLQGLYLMGMRQAPDNSKNSTQVRQATNKSKKSSQMRQAPVKSKKSVSQKIRSLIRLARDKKALAKKSKRMMDPGETPNTILARLDSMNEDLNRIGNLLMPLLQQDVRTEQRPLPSEQPEVPDENKPPDFAFLYK